MLEQLHGRKASGQNGDWATDHKPVNSKGNWFKQRLDENQG